jgi:hypothetical protein
MATAPDDPGRTPPGFPYSRTTAARAAPAARLKAWGITRGSSLLAICGGARDGDILFAEECRDLGADVRLLVPLPEAEFLASAVRGNAADWVGRYFALKSHPRCRVFFEHKRLGRPIDGRDRRRVHDRNNLWRLNSARAEVDADNLYVLTLWDELRQTSGPSSAANLNAVHKPGSVPTHSG